MANSKTLKLKANPVFKSPPIFKGSKFGMNKRQVGGFDPGRFKTQHKG